MNQERYVRHTSMLSDSLRQSVGQHPQGSLAQERVTSFELDHGNVTSLGLNSSKIYQHPRSRSGKSLNLSSGGQSQCRHSVNASQ